MRTTLTLVFIAGLAASCGDEPGALAADARFQLACPIDPAETGCGSALPPVDILGFDGDVAEDGRTINVSCNATSTDAGNIVSFSIGYGASPLLSVSGLVIPSSGSGNVSGNSCRVTATQADNRYGGTTLGTCGSAIPSEAQPCQFGAFTFDPDGESGTELTTTLVCRNLRAETAPDSLVRDITLPDSRSEAAVIKLINCEGL